MIMKKFRILKGWKKKGDVEKEGAEECINLPSSVVLGLRRLRTPARSWQIELQKTE